MELMQQIERPAEHGVVSGLCAGIARRYRLDPTVVRVIFVVLALSNGVGLVLYALGWLLSPGPNGVPVERYVPQLKDLSRQTWIAIAVISCLIVSGILSQWVPFGLVPALVILGVWYFGIRRPQKARERAQHTARVAEINPLAGPPTPFTEAARAWQQRIAEYQQGGPVRSAAAAADPAATPRAADEYATAPGYSMQAYLSQPDPAGIYDPPAAGPPPRKRRRSGRLWLIALIGIGLAIATLVLLPIPVAWYAYPAAALAVLGVVLVVAYRFGRPPLMVATAAVLAIVAVFGATAPPPGPPPAPTVLTYSTLAELPDRTQASMGEYDIDLRELQVTEDRTYRVELDTGKAVIRVPADANVRVTWQTDLAGVDVLGKTSDQVSGPGSTQRILDPSKPTLTLDIRVGFGSVEVQ
ncbi:PspC domain-containing protein [Granulicoccus phenolivorans]|uniref:PspC domain-containing protein n=1 Tax=Granulicoccus phenolivorans TaxID=266854 RepID=UPI00040C6A29|nr:PspC domain-containing protein [Granulicoccus phenolivorans]